MCGMQVKLKTIVTDRVTAGLLLMLTERKRVCETALQSVNDKEENDVMGGGEVTDVVDKGEGGGQESCKELIMRVNDFNSLNTVRES